MRTEGDYIKINEWLSPLSWFYGFGVKLRNMLFDTGILKSQSFNTPIISVGNITVGGSGKTPHVEYIIRLLNNQLKLAVLSRGYKRESKGYQLADIHSNYKDIGDEPVQMKQKFPDIYVAVDKNRRNGIMRLTTDEETKDTDVILLDDAYQHRYVKPGINILLVDYHRLIIYDKLLPAGRLREPQSGKSRADIVIITKCPEDLKPMEYRVLTKLMNLYPYQDLFFTALSYGNLKALNSNDERTLESLTPDEHILLITGIASPEQLQEDLHKYCQNILPLHFSDHHAFNKKDIKRINKEFESIGDKKKIIITTEKDATRIREANGLSQQVLDNLYVIPVSVKFMLDKEEVFNQKIISYVRKNSRNSILAKTKDDHKPENSNRAGNRPRTISFRDN